jgi:hypothetical protein
MRIVRGFTGIKNQVNPVILSNIYLGSYDLKKGE